MATSSNCLALEVVSDQVYAARQGTHLSFSPIYGLPRFTAQTLPFLFSRTFHTVLNSPTPIGPSKTKSLSNRESAPPILEVDTRRADLDLLFPSTKGVASAEPRMLACCSPSLYAADNNGFDTRASARCFGSRDKKPPFFNGEVGELAISILGPFADGAKG
jgi:hypothetical protein